MGVRRPLVAGVALLVLSGAGFGVSQMFGRPMEEPIRTKSGLVVEWVGWLNSDQFHGIPIRKDLNKASQSMRGDFIVFEYEDEMTDEDHASFFLAFDGKVIESQWVYRFVGNRWNVGFSRSSFPWNAKDIEIGIARGAGQVASIETLPEPINVIAIEEPSGDPSDQFSGNFTLSFPLYHPKGQSKVQKQLNAFSDDGEALARCGWVDRDGAREYCFISESDQVARLEIREREIEWFPIDWSHL